MVGGLDWNGLSARYDDWFLSVAQSRPDLRGSIHSKRPAATEERALINKACKSPHCRMIKVLLPSLNKVFRRLVSLQPYRRKNRPPVTAHTLKQTRFSPVVAMRVTACLRDDGSGSLYDIQPLTHFLSATLKKHRGKMLFIVPVR